MLRKKSLFSCGHVHKYDDKMLQTKKVQNHIFVCHFYKNSPSLVKFTDMVYPNSLKVPVLVRTLYLHYFTRNG